MVKAARVKTENRQSALDPAIILAGRFFRAGNGAAMKRHYQRGQVLKQGQVWYGRYRMPVLKEGRFCCVRVNRILGECSAMTKAEAKRALAELVRPINEGLHQAASASTFGELWAKYKAEVLVNYRESTRGFYVRTTERWILPYFERWPLEDVTPLAAQQFINKFGTYSKSVLRHIRASLSTVFKGGMDWGWCARNPALALKLPGGAPVKRAPILTPEEVGRVIEGLGEPWRTMAVLVGHLGIRESEVMALKWADFDTKRQVVGLARSVYRGAVGPVKTECGRREIPYGAAVAEALGNLKLEISNLRLKGGEYLFISPKGRFYTPQRITRQVFRPLASKLEIPPFTWRSFRRSAATAMHTAGVPVKVVQDILGHSQPDMTLLYTQPDMAAKRAAMATFDKLLEPGRVM